MLFSDDDLLLATYVSLKDRMYGRNRDGFFWHIMHVLMQYDISQLYSIYNDLFCVVLGLTLVRLVP